MAEFIVAKALGVSTADVRDEWGSFDLQTSDGVKVEVKSSAYLQSWAQTKLSTISFRTPKTHAFDPETNQSESELKRQADVYVFAVLTHQDKNTINPLNVDQWEFYVIPTITLDARTRSQYGITLERLKTELKVKAVGYSGLSAAVAQATEINTAQS